MPDLNNMKSQVIGHKIMFIYVQYLHAVYMCMSIYVCIPYKYTCECN